MAGNSQRKGSVRKTTKKPTAGSGGRVRRGLEGKGPTPKAKDRPNHKAYKAAQHAQKSQPGRPKRRPSGDAEWVAGRNSVVEALRAQADQGQPQFVTVVGEPGAGKSRLGAEVALRARAGGATVLVGRCSQEEDAPPLWPWAMALGPRLPTVPENAGDDHDAARFAIAESVRQRLADLSRDRLVLLQQQGRELGADAEPVVTPRPAHRLDRVAERPQPVDVLADRAVAHVEASRQVGTRPVRSGLEQTEKREESRGRLQHVGNLPEK